MSAHFKHSLLFIKGPKRHIMPYADLAGLVFRKPMVFRHLFKEFVQSHLKNCVYVRKPHFIRGLDILKQANRIFTNWFGQLMHMAYEQKQNALDLHISPEGIAP